MDRPEKVFNFLCKYKTNTHLSIKPNIQDKYNQIRYRKIYTPPHSCVINNYKWILLQYINTIKRIVYTSYCSFFGANLSKQVVQASASVPQDQGQKFHSHSCEDTQGYQVSKNS